MGLWARRPSTRNFPSTPAVMIWGRTASPRAMPSTCAPGIGCACESRTTPTIAPPFCKAIGGHRFSPEALTARPCGVRRAYPSWDTDAVYSPSCRPRTTKVPSGADDASGLLASRPMSRTCLRPPPEPAFAVAVRDPDLRAWHSLASGVHDPAARLQTLLQDEREIRDRLAGL